MLKLLNPKSLAHKPPNFIQGPSCSGPKTLCLLRQKSGAVGARGGLKWAISCFLEAVKIEHTYLVGGLETAFFHRLLGVH